MKAESERRKGRKPCMKVKPRRTLTRLILTPLPSLNIVSPSLSSLFVFPLSFLLSHLFIEAALCSMSLADELCYLGVIKVQLRLLVSVPVPKLVSLCKNHHL